MLVLSVIKSFARDPCECSTLFDENAQRATAVLLKQLAGVVLSPGALIGTQIATERLATTGTVHRVADGSEGAARHVSVQPTCVHHHALCTDTDSVYKIVLMRCLIIGNLSCTLYNYITF